MVGEGGGSPFFGISMVGYPSKLVGAAHFPLLPCPNRKNDKWKLGGLSRKQLNRDIRYSQAKKVNTKWLKKSFSYNHARVQNNLSWLDLPWNQTVY